MLFDPTAIGINIWAFQAARSIAGPLLDGVMTLVAESFLVVMPALFLYMYLKGDRDYYSYAFAAVAIEGISLALKFIVMEPRPCDLGFTARGIHCSGSYSFPSSHTTVLTGTAFYFAKYRYLRYMYLGWLALTVFGRVYLLQHFLTDVAAGLAIGAAVGYLIYARRRVINFRLGTVIGGIWVRLHG